MSQPEHIYVKGPPRSGKSTIALGLAKALEEAGKKVFIVGTSWVGTRATDLFDKTIVSLVADVYIWDGEEPLLAYAPEYRTITTQSLLSREEREEARKAIGPKRGEYLV